MAAVLGRVVQHINIPLGDDDEYYTGDDNNNNRSSSSSSSSQRCLDSPFAPYLIVAVALNAVAIVVGLVSQFHHRNHHDLWYLCNALFAAVHIAFAFYLVRKIHQPTEEYYNNKTTTNKNNNRNGYLPHDDNHKNQQQQDQKAPKYYNQGDVHVVVLPDQQTMIPTTSPVTWPRVQDVLLQDKLVAAYIVVFVVYAIWHVNYKNHRFGSQSADIFVLAGPASLALSIGMMMWEERKRENASS